MKIAFIGTGNLLEALLAGALGGDVPRDWMMCSTHTAERAYELGLRYGVACTPSNSITVTDANLVVLGVRPDETIAVAKEVADSLKPGAVVASASAATTLADLETALPDGVAVCRIMPSVAARAGHGICGVAFGQRVSDDQRDLVTTFLESMGHVIVTDENGLGAIGSLAGSGPAYVAKVAEAMTAGGVELGLDEETARTLTLATLKGTVALLEPPPPESESPTMSFDDVATAVGHPGGSTVRSLDHLERTRALDAVQAAVSHSYEA